jgi:hypothetical protein
MTTTRLDPAPTETDTARVLDRAASALVRRAEADVALLTAAAEWGELHPVPAGEAYAGWADRDRDLHGEETIPLAGAGAPLVAEFAPMELAAVLGWSTRAAKMLMGDSLEIKHRLPRLWRLVELGMVSVALARHVAQQTTDLSVAGSDHADALVSWDPRHLNRSRIDRLVDEARLFDEPDRAVDDEQQALASRTVRLRPGGTPATTDIEMSLDTPDALAFNDCIGRLAESLHRLGDSDSVDIRRAKAAGIMADPQRALDVLAGRAPAPTPPAAILTLHLDDTSLLGVGDQPRAVRCDRLGVLSTDLLRRWLTDATVVVRPVLDLARADARDRHDPPAWMSRLVRLRDRHCVFPGCRSASELCDLDHIEAYDEHGPPGQTRPDNLAPLCRAHHRAKTHHDWAYQRRDDGSYRWFSPNGWVIDVQPAPRRPRPSAHP